METVNGFNLKHIDLINNRLLRSDFILSAVIRAIYSDLSPIMCCVMRCTERNEMKSKCYLVLARFDFEGRREASY